MSDYRPDVPSGPWLAKPLSEAPAYLRHLADWLDVKYEDDPNREMQMDLRHWAILIEKLVGGIVDEVIAEILS